MVLPGSVAQRRSPARTVPRGQLAVKLSRQERNIFSGVQCLIVRSLDAPLWKPLLDLAVACGGKNEAADGGGAGGKGPGSKDGGLPKIMLYAVVQPRNTLLNNDLLAIIQGQQNVKIRPKVDGFAEAIYVGEGPLLRRSSRCSTLLARRGTRRLCVRPKPVLKPPWPM